MAEVEGEKEGAKRGEGRRMEESQLRKIIRKEDQDPILRGQRRAVEFVYSWCEGDDGGKKSRRDVPSFFVC